MSTNVSQVVLHSALLFNIFYHFTFPSFPFTLIFIYFKFLQISLHTVPPMITGLISDPISLWCIIEDIFLVFYLHPFYSHGQSIYSYKIAKSKFSNRFSNSIIYCPPNIVCFYCSKDTSNNLLLFYSTANLLVISKFKVHPSEYSQSFCYIQI